MASFKTFLDALAKDTLKMIGIAEPIAEAAEPIIAVAAPAILPLYNLTINLIKNVEAVGVAAGTSTGTGAQKMALVVQDLEPIAVQYLASLGVSAPTTAQVQAYAQAIYDSLTAFSALSTAAPAKTP